MNAPKVSAKAYALTWLGLLMLTAATSVIGLIDLGPFSFVLALVIAAMKATLIVGFFMHAFHEFKLVHVIIAGAVLMLLIALTLTLNDYMTRGWLPFPGK